MDLLNPRLMLQYRIFDALVSYGPEARSGLPAIISGLEADNPLVQENAADALGKLRIEPELVVPALTEALDSPNSYLIRGAARALAAFGSEAQAAIPKLAEIAGRTNLMVPARHAVNESLRTITNAISKSH
jgi:HEAT repeat protein